MKYIDKKIFHLNGDIFCFNPNTLRIYKLNENEYSIEKIISSISNQYEIHDRYTEESKKLDCLTIILTNNCNLNCGYCYYNYNPNRIIQDAILENILKSYALIDSYYQDGIDTIQFFGGEPLIKFDLITTITSKISEYCKTHQRNKPSFGLNTNGTLLDANMLKFFYDNKYSISISIDGKKENNIYRVDRAGRSTYDRIAQIMNDIHISYPNYKINAEMTFSAHNIMNFTQSKKHDIEALNDLGFHAVHASPVISENEEYSIFSETLVANQLQDYIEYMYRYSFNSLNSPNPIYLSDYQLYSNLINNKEYLSCFCPAGTRKIAIDQMGRILPCHMYIDNYNQKNINLSSFFSNNYKKRKKMLNEICSNCWCYPFCNKCDFQPMNSFFCDYMNIKSQILIEEIIKLSFYGGI